MLVHVARMGEVIDAYDIWVEKPRRLAGLFKILKAMKNNSGLVANYNEINNKRAASIKGEK